MAKSSLEIVLVDEGSGAAEGAAPVVSGSTLPAATQPETSAPSAPVSSPDTAPPPVGDTAAPAAQPDSTPDGAAPQIAADRPEKPAPEPEDSRDVSGKLLRAVDLLTSAVGLGGLTSQIKSAVDMFATVKGALDAFFMPRLAPESDASSAESPTGKPSDATPLPPPAPETAAPEVKVEVAPAEIPETQVHVAPPQVSAPEVKVDAPRVEAPEVRVDAPQVEIPKQEAPQLPDINLPEPNDSQVDPLPASMPSAGKPVPAPVAAPATSSAGAGVSSAVAAAVNPVTVALAGVTVAAVGTGVALKKMSDVFHAEAQKLEGYSTEVAAASAENEVRQELAMLRRAEQIGPQLAQAEKLRGRFEEAMSDAWTKILEVLLQIFEAFSPILSRIPAAIDVFTSYLDLLNARFDQLIAVLTPMTKEDDLAAARRASEATVRLGKAFEEFLKGQEDEEEPAIDPFFEQFMNSGPKAPQPVAPIPMPAIGGI